jgi:hypothetical protein
MPKSRASIFTETDEAETPALDVSSFAPKVSIDTTAPQREEVREVSKSARFTSREAAPPKSEPKASKRPARRYRTGRNVQVSIKALAESVDRFYAITDANPGWVLGYTFQRAIEALDRELKQSK